MSIDIIKSVRASFPIFKNKINNNDLFYLDNAAITQVPEVVVDTLRLFYFSMNANIHRGAYYLSELATEKYEATRSKVASFIGAKFSEECIFVKNTTEGINLVANSYLKQILNSGDEILISQMEHHSNIVPWYLLCQEKKDVSLKVIPINESGDLNYKSFLSLLNPRVKLLAITHVSNSLGTINNLKYLIEKAHLYGIPVLVDGAQSFSNSLLNVCDLDCDFFAFSSHKMFGPNGLGVLYVKREILEKMVPYQGGGEMIKHVSFSNILWNDIPYKFEAGTQSIANVVAFGSTIDFLNGLNLDFLYSYKKRLFEYACDQLKSISGLRFIGNPSSRAEILSFVIDGIHPHDLGTVANFYGVSIRTGHHCSIPVMDFYKLSATARISLSIYNTEEDISRLIMSIKKAKKIFL